MPSVPRKARKRVGRGESSGLGKTSGKGSNGQNSRAGGGVKTYFEGGQMPIYRRVPKRGFSNAIFKKEYALISLDLLKPHIVSWLKMKKVCVFSTKANISPPKTNATITSLKIMSA